MNLAKDLKRPVFNDAFWLFCRPCETVLDTKHELQQHHATIVHQQKTSKAMNAEGFVRPYEKWCSICDERVPWNQNLCFKCHPVTQSGQTLPQSPHHHLPSLPTHSLQGSGVQSVPGQVMSNGSIALDATCRVVCLPCSSTRTFDAMGYAQHTYSPTHQEKLHTLRTQTGSITATLAVAYRCLCSFAQFATYYAYAEHLTTRRHVKRMKAKTLIDKMSRGGPEQHQQQASSASSSTSVGGDSNARANIWVDHSSFNFGYAKKGQEHKRDLSLVNRGAAVVQLTNAVMMPRPGWGSSFVIEGPRSASIAPGDRVDYTLLFTPQHTGYYEQCVIFRFKCGQELVGRMTGAVSNSPADLESLAPSTPFKKKKMKDDRMLGRAIVKSDAVIIQDARRPFKNGNKLGHYITPDKLAATLRLSTDDALTIIGHQIKLPFTKSSYAPAMSTMLFAEEAAMNIDIRQYDLHDVTLQQTPGKRYFLQVPGLAEGRPSVIRTDKICVLPTRGLARNTKVYEGRVIEVHLERVMIEFHRAFHAVFSADQRFDVRFSFNRQPLRRMHAAINAPSVTRFAFPAAGASSSLPDEQFTAVREAANQLTCFNPKLATNPEQKLAVSIILNKLHGSTPFVLFGPPGTGKTVTLVEAILQIRRKATDLKEQVHILVSTPSNSAADVILDRLAASGVTKDQMIRVNSPSRSPWTMPMAEHLEKYCFYDKEGYFTFPSMDVIDNANIVVATNIAAGAFRLHGHPKTFTHIILDEAGQCVEPETLVPLQLANANTSVVLAGDHKQLGPVVRSPIASALGFNMSMLERLVSLPPDQTPYPWCQNPKKSSNNFGVKLLINYRAHRDIIDMPNRLFYEGELHSEVAPAIANRFLAWPGLPKPDYPVKFVGVEGLDQREGNSPSWFNAFEAEAVVTEIQSILQYSAQSTAGPGKIKGADIGVVAPYRKQVQKIRQLLKQKAIPGHEDITVDTVERFQGLERAVMVVSTVRSKPQWLEFDKQFHLGFLNNPKRFNVAVTRARSLLILVGNPNVLVQDRYWAAQIREIAKRGGATGAAVPMLDIDESAVVDELVRLMDSLDVHQYDTANEEEDESDDEVDGLSNEDSWSTSVQDYLSTATVSAAEEEEHGADGSDSDSASFHLV